MRHARVGLPGTAAVIVGLVGLVLLTACSGPTPVAAPAGSPTSSSSTTSPSASTASASPPAFGLAPLTGLPQASSVAAARPAVTVVVDVRTGAAGSTAPVGLNRADLVFAEYDDPGSSRLLAVFQSQLAADVGPVGQTRTLDPKLVPLWGGPYAYAGGPQGFVGRLAPAGVVDAGLAARPTGYHHGAGVLLASTSALLAATPAALSKGLRAPAGYLTYGTDGQALAAAGVTPATTATLVVPGHGSQVWTCDPATGRWQQPQLDVSVSTLAVRLTSYEKVSLNHGVAPFTLTPKPFGTGPATLLSGCQKVAATWSQPGATRTVNFLAAGNQPTWLVPGPTWMVFAPPGTTVQVS